MKKYIDENREWWNEVTEVNFHSLMYNVEEFLKGGISLLPVISEETQEIFKDKEILHLQCHFGMDSISLIRNGAKEVTGVDFSENAIKYAEELKSKLGINNVKFIQSNVYELNDILNEEFDVIFTSLGVLEWLNDLNAWGNVIQKHLKKNGIFYLFDYHPMALVFARGTNINEFKVEHPYFEKQHPYQLKNGTAYSNMDIKIKSVANEWQHSMSEVVNSLVDNRLKLIKMKEYPFIDYPKFSFMTKTNDDKYWHSDNYDLPYMFSLLMKKEGTN